MHARGVLAAPVQGAFHPGVEALVNLARFAPAHVRQASAWRGSETGWQGAIASLAQHLLGRYRVPRFLAAVWSDPAALEGDERRGWYVAHARGAAFRSLDLPMRMTRRMEHVFLATPDHVSIEQAFRRAELFDAGVPLSLAVAVLDSQMGSDLRHPAFWRTVWAFLVRHARDVVPDEVGPMMDFIHTIRHKPIAVEAATGVVFRDPPQPSFSIKGRTLASVRRLIREWHRRLGFAHAGLTWKPSPLRPLTLEDASHDPSRPATLWHFTELTSGIQLRAEGTALRHCVATYADRCWRGASRIWSLRAQREGRLRHVLTIELDVRRRAVVQARGWANRPASGRPLQLLYEWCARERLRVAF